MAEPARQPLFEKIARLPPARVAEVEEFVDFLALRIADREIVAAAAAAAAAAAVPAFAKVWDNPEDDVYNET